MSKVDDMLDEIMSDLGISDEIARSIRQTEKKSTEEDTKQETEISSLDVSSYNINTEHMLADSEKTYIKENVRHNYSNNKKKQKKDSSTILIRFFVSMAVNILFYAVVIFGIVKMANVGFNFAYDIYAGKGQEESPGRNISFEIEEGTSSYDIAKQLEINKIISNRYSFLIRLKLSEKSVQSDTYTLSTSMTYDEIIGEICN